MQELWETTMFRVSLVSLLVCVGFGVIANLAPPGLLNDLSMVASSVAALVCIGSLFFGIAQRIAPDEEEVRPPSDKTAARGRSGRRAA